MCIKPRVQIHLTNGRAIATSGAIIPSQRATSRLTWLALTILTSTELGAAPQNMERCGPLGLKLVGRHIPPVTGFGMIHGDGLGLTTSLGDSLPSIMDVGSMPGTTGDGRQARSM